MVSKSSAKKNIFSLEIEDEEVKFKQNKHNSKTNNEDVESAE